MYATAEENDFTFDDLHPDFMLYEDETYCDDAGDAALCDYCAEPSSDLECVESGDPTVGYRESQWLCATCRAKIGRRG